MLSLSTRIWIRIKTIYLRITFTRCTLALFLTTFGLCFLQSVVQSLLYSVDNDYSSLVSRILDTGNAPYGSHFAQMDRSNQYQVQLCTSLPGNGYSGKCEAVFNSSSLNDATTRAFPNMTQATDNQVNLQRGAPDNQTGIYAVQMVFPDSVEPWPLSANCLQTLIYPDQVLKNSKREELALIGAQFWILVATIYAIVAESVPHLLAAAFVRFCCTTWSAYAIWRTSDVQKRFNNIIINSGTPCHADLFPGYMRRRGHFEGPDLFLGVFALIVCGAMSLKLMKIYKKKTFARIGVSVDIQRIYRFYMAVLACLQIAFYFLITSLSLWLDQLIHGALAHIATFSTVYKVQSGVELGLLLPWSILGWYALTSEHRLSAAIFIAWAVVMVICTAFDFYSVAFQWTFLQWPFFGSVTTASLGVLLLAAGFAGVSTARFGRGFASYLHAERVLASTDFASDAHMHSPTKTISLSADTQRQGDAAPTPTYLRPFGQ